MSCGRELSEIESSRRDRSALAGVKEQGAPRSPEHFGGCHERGLPSSVQLLRQCQVERRDGLDGRDEDGVTVAKDDADEDKAKPDPEYPRHMETLPAAVVGASAARTPASRRWFSVRVGRILPHLRQVVIGNRIGERPAGECCSRGGRVLVVSDVGVVDRGAANWARGRRLRSVH